MYNIFGGNSKLTTILKIYQVIYNYSHYLYVLRPLQEPAGE